METMEAELAEILDGIGPRLRALRRDRGLTLETLAADTGISVSTLSRLESGKRRPTLELLIPLARAHRVALDQLVAAPATGDPRVHLKPYRRNARQRRRAPDRVPWPGPGLQADPRTPAAEARHPPGYEWLYVLAGNSASSSANATYPPPGQVAEFDTSERHWFGPADTNTVEILHLFGPHGDQAIIRTEPSTTS